MPRTRHLVPRALRRSFGLRLALGYGLLLAAVLGLFGVTVYVLTANATREGARAQVRAEARVATAGLRTELTAGPPYWPDQLRLEAVDTDRDPGIMVQVVDARGRVRYQSSGGRAQSIHVDRSALAAAMRGQERWYEARAGGVPVQVEAVPVYSPHQAGARGAPIGTLLVAKSLADETATLATLRSLLLASGAVLLLAALGGGWAIAARALAPLRDVAATAGAVAAATASGTRVGSLSPRVPRPAGEDELARLVDAFNTMLAALQSATARQHRFVADASHELRAPLTTIQGNLALLLAHDGETAPAEQRAMLADAHAETLRLVNLVNELLALARAEAAAGAAGETGAVASASPPARRPLVDLDRVVLGLVRQARARLAAAGSGVELRLAHVEPVRLRGDEEALHRLGLILLDNAVKYTPADGRAAVVTVALEREGDEAVLRVRDTGIGIDPGDLPHIFERFYRADRARDRQGTGLGLPIARTVAEQHGGSIAVESTPGQGSTFTVRLPAPPLG